MRSTSSPRRSTIAIIALFFVGLGLWVGLRLSAPTARESFERNTKAIDYLGISKREYEVLELLTQGHSNQKSPLRFFRYRQSHLGRLYEKLEVSRRTQAAREVYLAMTDYAFIDHYTQSMIASEAAADAASRYANPAFRLPVTFLQIFPVGLLITLASAGLLKRGATAP